MYFITLWDRKGGKANAPDDGKSRKFEFRAKSGVSESFYCCERVGEDDYVEHGFRNLANLLRHNDRKQVLIYIHGFNNLPEDSIFQNAETLQRLLDEDVRLNGSVIVLPLIWPCADQVGVVRDYFTDQMAAELSGISISRTLQKFVDWQRENNENQVPCLKRINVLAHSMGNRVLVQALSNFQKLGTVGMPQMFRNVFMVAADVENEILERDQPGHIIPAMSRNVVVCYANDDLAMPASKIANVKHGILSKRLGLSGPERWAERSLANNVYAADCDAFNNDYRDLKGHTYFLDDKDGAPGKAFEKIAEVLHTGRFHADPNKRHEVL